MTLSYSHDAFFTTYPAESTKHMLLHLAYGCYIIFLPYAVITNEISCFNVIAWKGYKRYLSKSVACGTSCSIVSTIFDDATNNGVGGSMNNCSPSNLPQKVHAQHLRHNQQTISRVTRNHDQCLSHVVMCLSVFFFSFFESGKSLGGAS